MNATEPTVKKRKGGQPRDDEGIWREAYETYLKDLCHASNIFYGDYYHTELIVDTTWDGEKGQPGAESNARTLLALAEGIRMRRLDAEGRHAEGRADKRARREV